MTQNMKCMIEMIQNMFDPKTQKLITSMSSKASRHWPHTMIPTLFIISKVMIQEVSHLSVELCIVVVILILNINHVIYPSKCGSMIRIHLIAYRQAFQSRKRQKLQSWCLVLSYDLE